MAKSTLKAKVRVRLGKSGSRAVRREGNIPAILYSKGTESIPLVIDPADLKKALSTDAGRNTLLDIEIESEGKESKKKEKKLSLLSEIQMDYLSNSPIHLDFHAVNMDDKIEVKVPVVFTGRAQGVKEGGILEEMIREVTVSCTPGNIPDVIEFDVTELVLGDGVQIKDLELPEGTEVVGNPDDTLAMVHVPRALVVETPTEAEEGEEGVEGEGEEGAEGTEEGKAEEGGDKSEGGEGEG